MAKDVLSSEKCATLLKVLADNARLRIIQTLWSGPLSVSEVAAALSLDIAIVSHHLGVLRRHGMVTTERHGKSILYELAADVLQRSRGDRQHINLGCCRLEIPNM